MTLKLARLSAMAALAQALLLGLGGCAAEPVRHDDDGTMTIRCAGGYHDWSGCFSRAEAACGSPGFEILSRVSNEGSDGVGSRDWSQAGSEVSRTLVVRCR